MNIVTYFLLSLIYGGYPFSCFISKFDMPKLCRPSNNALTRAHVTVMRQLEKQRALRIREEALTFVDSHQLDRLHRGLRENNERINQHSKNLKELIAAKETDEVRTRRRTMLENQADHPNEVVRQTIRDKLDNFLPYEEYIKKHTYRVKNHEYEISKYRKELSAIEREIAQENARRNNEAKKHEHRINVSDVDAKRNVMNNFPVHVLWKHGQHVEETDSGVPHSTQVSTPQKFSKRYLQETPTQFGRSVRFAMEQCGIDNETLQRIRKERFAENEKQFQTFKFLRAMGYTKSELNG